MLGRVLIVDDDQNMCELIEVDMKRRGFRASWFTSAEEALDGLKKEEFDVVLTDLNLPGINGIDLCDRVVKNRPDMPVVVITAFGSLDTAVAALRAGAYDFVTKPVEMEILALTLERAVKHRRLQEQVRILSEKVKHIEQFDQLLGESSPMQRLYDQLMRVADSEAPVLVTGESGTGKELVARALHKKSRRHAKPFVAVSCAALPGPLLESELFGHTKGAFTDAREARRGLFLQAEGGTLFLDEIGDFPMALQPKLLRALEERAIRPIGGDREITSDVRIIAATNRDLDAAVQEASFREDLFFRINVIQVAVPPLRERGTDILLLAQHFMEQFSTRSGKSIIGLSEGVAENLLGYPWPGNVRELRNAVEHAVALTRYDKLAVEDLPEKIRAYSSRPVLVGSDDLSELIPMEEVERRYILHVLKAVDGSKTQAAQLLGLDRKTLYRKLRRYNEIGDDKS